MSPVSWGDIFTLLLRGDRIMELRHTPLIPLCRWNLLSKMPDRTVGSQGLIPRGTFREHFTFHSWQAEMDCQTAFEREADSQMRLAQQQVMRLMIRWSRMPNWSSNASRATGRPGRNLCVAIRAASLTFATGSRETGRNRRTCRRMSSSGFTAHWEAIVLPMAVSQLGRPA